LGLSAQEINKFIQQLMRGPYGKGAIIELAAPEEQTPQIETPAQPKSLLEEGAEILARLRSIRGEDVEEKPTVLFPSAQSGSSEAAAMEISNPGEEPTVLSFPPPIMPPRASQPPVAVPPPMAPPPSAVPSAGPLPRAPPASPPMAPPAAPPRTSFTGPPAAQPRPAAVPVQAPTILPPPAPPSNPPSKAPLPFSNPPIAPPRPMAFPVQDRPESTSAIPLPETPLPRLTEEPQVIQVSEPVSEVSEQRIGAPSLKDEKNEILARLTRELPNLPENDKGPIIEELMKRPAGKLRETWFKIIVHKNKQYA
jgi:hypothetical protein